MQTEMYKTTKFASQKIRKEFIANFVDELTDSNLSFFLGAGTSIGAGFPSWENLLENIAEKINIDIKKEINYYQIFQYCVNELGSSVVERKVSEKLSRLSHQSEGIESILKLPIDSFWTTNFDQVLERNIEDKYNVKPTIIYKDTDLKKVKKNLSTTNFKVFKLNGHLDDQESWVLTQNDLEEYSHSHQGMLTFFRRELVQNTFFFLGNSFSDTLILTALSEVKKYFGELNQYHYTILERDPKRQDFDYFVKDLELRYGIKTLVVESYDEVPLILNEINDKLRKKQIFFSGSYRNISREEQNFITSLSEQLTTKLLEKDFKICSGMGRRLGDLIAGSSLRWLVENNHLVNKRLILRPDKFYQHGSDGKPNDTTRAMREYAQHDCGVAVFLCGQETDTSKGSEGTYQEFEIAKENGLKIIPIGATGYEARKIWQEIKNNITNYGYLERYIDSLNDEKDPEELTKIILQIIESIQQ